MAKSECIIIHSEVVANSFEHDIVMQHIIVYIGTQSTLEAHYRGQPVRLYVHA